MMAKKFDGSVDSIISINICNLPVFMFRMQYICVFHFVKLKGGGLLFPLFGAKSTFRAKFQSNLRSKLSEIFIHCNMLTGSIFYAFFKSERLGPK